MVELYGYKSIKSWVELSEIIPTVEDVGNDTLLYSSRSGHMFDYPTKDLKTLTAKNHLKWFNQIIEKPLEKNINEKEK